MPVSPTQQAKRSLVKVLVTLAALYGVVLHLSRDAPDEEVKRAFRRMSIKAHPDKGGSVEHAQELNGAREAWEKSKRSAKAGRPKDEKKSKDERERQAPTAAAELPDLDTKRKVYRVQAMAVLLTYHGVEDLDHWRCFLNFVSSKKKEWKVKYWCATLEANQDGRLHIHLFLQFTSLIDRPSRSFSFQSLVPNARCCDLLGDGFCKRKLQESVDRGFFYCWADKRGTQRDEEGNVCVCGNYYPAWTSERCKYAVKGRWVESLWQAYKLSTEKYEEYLFKCRDGVVYRKRQLDACRGKEKADAQQVEIADRVKRIRSNSKIFKPFPVVPAAAAWLSIFKEDRLRYPIMVVFGPSAVGKTEWAKSLFQRPLVLLLGSLTHFPDKMRTFERDIHDGIILDDLRDFKFLMQNQEKVQGKYDSLVEFASTPGGGLAYTKDLFALPIIVTANYDTANRELLKTSDWLSRPENVVQVTFPPAE